MVALTSIPRCTVLTDCKPHDTSLPAFMVSTPRGFLPRMDPVVALPPAFAALESLLTRMPIVTATGEPGLLASGELGERVHAELGDLSDAVERYKEDLPLMTAVYRDYSFLASAYLLEPCHVRFVRGEEYGLGRQVLPACIARPIARVSAIIGFKPYMEYAGSYALYNYRLADPTLGLTYPNLRLIRAFERGLDPTSSEAGFVLVHIAMAAHTGPLVAGAVESLDGIEAGNRGGFNAGSVCVAEAMGRINEVMETMWTRSKPRSYTAFRTFIFGITAQSMFPEGVVYEGVDFDDDDDGVDGAGGEGKRSSSGKGNEPKPQSKPRSFRGESGANDSIVPLLDSLLQVQMPRTPLTAILLDFRQYRPGDHRAFLASLAARAAALDVRAFATRDQESAALYLRILDQLREFRWRHWCFAKEYILRQTRHPTATGGSPVVTWLPNQLQAVLGMILEVEGKCARTGWVQGVVERARGQLESLEREVEEYRRERGA